MTARPDEVVAWPALPEPVGWTFQHDETGRMCTLENDGINNPENFAKNNPRHTLCDSLYSEKQMRAYADSALQSANARHEAAERNACLMAELASEWKAKAESANARLAARNLNFERVAADIDALAGWFIRHGEGQWTKSDSESQADDLKEFAARIRRAAAGEGDE